MKRQKQLGLKYYLVIVSEKKDNYFHWIFAPLYFCPERNAKTVTRSHMPH